MRFLHLFAVAAVSVLLSLLLLLGIAIWYFLNSANASTVLVGALAELSAGALSVRTISGPLGGPLQLEGLIFEDAHLRLEIEHARLDWSLPALMAGQIRVQDLTAGAMALTLKPGPARDPEAPATTRLPLSLVVKNAAIASFSLVTAPGAQALRFESIQLVADWSGDEVAVEKLQLRYAPVGALDLQGTLQLQPHALALRKLLIGGFGALKLDGVIGYDSRIQMQAGWQDLRWPQDGPPQLQSRSGTLGVEGRWEDFAYELSGDFSSTPLQATLKGRGRGNLGGLEVAELSLQTLGGRIRASGALRWNPQISVSARGDFDELNPQALAGAWPGRLNGSFDGSLDALAPLQGRLTLALRESQLRGYPLNLQAQAETRNRALSLQRLELRSGHSVLTVQGPLQPQLDARAELQSPDLGELWPGLAGTAKATLRLRGSREQPRIHASAQVQQLRYAGLGVTDLTLQMNLDAQESSDFKLELRDALAGVHFERLTLSGEGDAAANRFVLNTRSDVGVVEMRFAGALDLPGRRWQGQVTSGRGEPLRLSPWTLQEPTALAFGADGVTLEPLCWRSNTGRACLQGRQQAEESRLAFRVERLMLAYFEPLLPPAWKLSGDVSGTGLLVRAQSHLQAQLDMRSSAGELVIGSREVLRFAPSSWVAEETADGFVSKLQLPLADGGIYWDALLSPAPAWSERRWSGEVRAHLSTLQPLRLLSPELESVDGRLDGRFQISGSAGAPRLEGGLQLREGRLRLATPAIELSAVTADVVSSAGSGLLRFNAQAASGGGELRLEGSADVAHLSDSLKLELSGERFQAAATSQARVWVSPKLSFSLQQGRADLKGEVVVPRAEITPTSFDQGVAPSGDQVIIGAGGAPTESGLLKIYTDVRVTLGDEVKFSGFGLTTQLTGGLQAIDEPGRATTARGEVRLQGGRYKAYGQDLSIETGRLLFTGGLITAPAVDIRAQRVVTDEVTVGLNVRGLLTAPEFSLYSTPPMPQDQQLAWLVLGRPLQTTGSNSSADRSALTGAALSLGLSGGNFFAQKLRGGLRLDEISIASKPGETSDQAQLTFGKYLSPKLFVSYGIGLFQPGQAFRLLYDIGHGFKLSTESGVESGGDLVYTIEK